MKTAKFSSQQLILIPIIILGIIVGSSVTSQCNNQSKIGIIGNSSGDTIDVAVVFGPVSYYFYGDTIGGINYELIKHFENETKTPMKIWPVVDPYEALQGLEDGTYDILASLPSDLNLKHRFLVSQSMFLDRLVLIQLMDSFGNTKINSSLQLNGDTVFIQDNSIVLNRIKNLEKEIGGKIYISPHKDLSEEYLCIKTALGEIPLAIVNENVAESMQKIYPSLSFNNPVSFTQFQVWLFPQKDSLLLNKVDIWFENFKNTAVYKKIIETY